MTVTNQEPRPLQVLIIGAGLAGLTAAIALGKQGHDVVIVEKSKFSREAGAAIHVPPNCTALLNWLGIDPKDFGGTLLEQIHRYDHLGNLKYKKDFSGIRQMWQAEWYLVHRVDLHNHLKQRALETATLHMGCKIVSIDVDRERPSITLDNGERFEGDLLLGADGLHSIVRETIGQHPPPPFPAGKSCFRWLLSTDDLRRLPSTKDMVQEPGVFIEWARDDRRLVAYPCSNNRVFNLCAFLPTREAGGLGEGWQATGSKDALMSGFSAFAPAVKELVNRADDTLKVWELFDMNALPTWVRGRSALLGDAAHPFQPYMGQGGAMAIEDAVSLAVLLPAGTRMEDLPARLALYEEARRSRIDLVLQYTRMNGVDDNDTTAKRMTAAEMVKFMGICFTHNEIKNSTALLELSKQG
ncbi:FAD/NAD(P)-binding domain-containing protein [Aspergillus saccharolyticus JOP 1030-1]|uniref:FAD/NAD(P)-binding domain-containing protein n=1 Tax=Aspergillus saccharolyticus JOP 1030-1 TaxID=1450539 RepID=A0A318Z1K4_9EURO|nr:FAD/NAD(P)-binding domain-containing protein [Aspergillus saccharolyticus JOP 1030-1]PYH40157.1 FAD/NAD(P)-binding domain-containing protein [Aspergillus saccharolyticus JOP 1030-1]